MTQARDSHGRFTIGLIKNTDTIGPLRIEKPKWYEFGKRRQYKRLGIHK